MKQDTKDWLKRTAGTSALVASPGVLAATAIGGPLAGLAVGGAVAAGNVVGSLAYKKYRDVKEDIENRKKFRELQKHVLAQNGILYYQPMVPAPATGAGDMSLSRSQKKEIRSYANSKAMDIAKNRIDTLVNSIRTDGDKVGKLTSKPFFKEMNMSCKDMSCLGKILHKDFTINQVLGNALYNTKVGQVIDKGITLADNLGEGIITRNGNTVRSDFKKLTGFSEDSLLAVDEEELKHMREDIEFTSDPSEKELKKSRYLSMLNEVSRDRLEELLDEGKPEEEKEAKCDPPVSMFSESPNLQNIAKGGDFGIWSTLLSKTGSALSKIATKVSEKGKNLAAGLTKKAAEGAAKVTEEASEKVAEGAAKVAEKASEKVVEDTQKISETVADTTKKVTEVTDNATKGSDYQKPKYSLFNNFTKKGRTSNIEARMEDNSILAKVADNTGLGRHAVAEGVRIGQDAAKTYMSYQVRKEAAKNQNRTA